MERSTAEREFLLLSELQKRRESDPLFTWQPHPKQRDFIDSVLGTECYENYALWANRAGKTDVGAFCGSYLARFGLPDSEVKPSIGPSTVVYDRATSGWVVALTSNLNRDVTAPKYFDNGFVPAGSSHQPFIPAREIAQDGWRVTDKILRLKNGSIIGFKGCADGRDTFQGAGKDWIHFDEEPPKDIFQEATLRIEAGRRLRIFATCTLLPPVGQSGGVTWLYTEKAVPFVDGKPVQHRIFQARIYDNPHILPTELALLESQYPPGSIEYRIRLDGELLPGLSGARAYGAFSSSIHVQETGPLEPRRPLCWCLDFNVEPMIALIGQYRDGIFKVHHEIIIESGSVSDMGKRFRLEYPSHRAEIWIYGDATGGYRDVQTAKTDYQILLNELRGYPVPIQMKIPPSNPHVPARINAVNRALKDEYGQIGVMVDPSCEELIADLRDVLRDPKGGIYKTYNKADTYSRRTHTSDALGYWIAQEQPVTGEPIGMPKKQMQVSAKYIGFKQPSYGFNAKV